MVSSHSSTACVSPINDTVEKVIKNDTVRYKRKGFGLIIAAIQAIAYFTFLPPFLESIYPSLIAGWDHRWFSCFSITLVHMTANLSFYLLSYFIYKAKSPFLERYKSTDEPWPWESDPKEWKEMLRKSVMLFLFNNLVVAPLLTIGDTVLGGVTLRTTTNVYPSMKDTLLQILFCMIVEDFCFYCGHRLLHHRALYPHIHKIHHQYNQTISIANEYAHPVEFLISNLIPSTLGPKLLGKQMHITTFWIWVIMRVGESVDGHCGYDFSWSPFRLLPLSGSATYHAYHHSANVGNYCSLFTFWDTVFQTNRDYWLWLSKHQKEEVLKDTAANVKGQVAPVSKTIDGVSKAAGKDLLKHQKDE